MKAHWGSGCIAPLILWSASLPGRFTPREWAPGTHWIGSSVGPRAVLDAVVKRKIPSPGRESNPRTPIFQPIAQRYTDWAITALLSYSKSQLTSETMTPVRHFGRSPWTGDQPVARPIPTQDSTKHKERGHTTMPRAGFEPTISVLEWPITIGALDHEAAGFDRNVF
jgi:hypothetical protein